MSMHNEKHEIKKIGIDLAKSSFQIYGEDQFGKKVLNRKMSRSRLKEFMLKQQPCEVAMEACGSAHSGLLNRRPRKTLGFATPTEVFFFGNHSEKILRFNIESAHSML